MEDVGRVFVAIGLPPHVRMAASDYADRLRLPGRRVDPADLHITLRFLGDIDVVAFERLVAALDDVEFPDPFSLRLTGLGVFPSPRSATVAWIGIAPSDALVDTHSAVEHACEQAGLGREERPFRPHLTLSRIRPPVDLRRLSGSAPELRATVDVDRLVILRSTLGGSPPRYEPLDFVDL